MKYTPAQIKEISHREPAEIAVFITGLLDHIEKLERHIGKLETRIHSLERQVGLTSANSSKPPSSDGLRKPKSLRTSGGKKGAPKNHDGHTLQMVETPDVIETHTLHSCAHCNTSLQDVPVITYGRRQVFDLPLPQLIVTEHRLEKKCCPNCGTKQQARAPKQVNAPVQYGESWTAWCTYLHTYHNLPLERIGQLFLDMTGQRPSDATLLRGLASISAEIQPLTTYIRKELANSACVHADETGMRVQGKTQWLHTVSSDKWTLYQVHEKRGRAAIDAHDVLPTYKGILVHDCWASYFHKAYAFEHALCGAHLLRECQGVMDYDQQHWAAEMKALLQEACHEKKEWRQTGTPISEEKRRDFSLRYDKILEKGEQEWATPSQTDAPVKRGRKKKSKAANLGERFRRHKAAILRFLQDAHVPFDNSLAERDMRMMKVKQKVSGSFRTQEGAEQFALIRSFLSSLRKQKRDILPALLAVVRGQFVFD